MSGASKEGACRADRWCADSADSAQTAGKSVGRWQCKSRRWSAGKRSDGTGKGDTAWARDEGVREVRRARG